MAYFCSFDPDGVLPLKNELKISLPSLSADWIEGIYEGLKNAVIVPTSEGIISSISAVQSFSVDDNDDGSVKFAAVQLRGVAALVIVIERRKAAMMVLMLQSYSM